jgi:hypothetical protein
MERIQVLKKGELISLKKKDKQSEEFYEVRKRKISKYIRAYKDLLKEEAPLSVSAILETLETDVRNYRDSQLFSVAVGYHVLNRIRRFCIGGEYANKYTRLAKMVTPHDPKLYEVLELKLHWLNGYVSRDEFEEKARKWSEKVYKDYKRLYDSKKKNEKDPPRWAESLYLRVGEMMYFYTCKTSWNCGSSTAGYALTTVFPNNNREQIAEIEFYLKLIEKIFIDRNYKF